LLNRQGSNENIHILITNANTHIHIPHIYITNNFIKVKIIIVKSQPYHMLQILFVHKSNAKVNINSSCLNIESYCSVTTTTVKTP